MVGSMAIILLVSIAKGVQADVTGQVKDIGVNILVVIPGRIEEGTFNPNLGGGSFLKEEDAQSVSKIPGVVQATPWSFVGGGAVYHKKTANSMLVATTPKWFQMHPMALEKGRIFGADEDKADVCVIGSVARKTLFGDAEAIGRKIHVNKRDYEVVGVTQDKKSEQSLFSMGGLQNLIYLPYHRLQEFQPDLQTDRIMIQTEPGAEPKRLIKQLDATLGKRLEHQQYQVLTQEDLLGLVFKLMSILTWLLTGLTSIALFVGGVGIMAVMLMSVNERAKEIGVRKTVGATRNDMFQQFLAEAVTLSLAGGLVGLVLSYFICEGLRTWTPIKPLITLGVIALAFGVSIGVGAIFGLIPAMHAARKDPVAALRSE